jgi:hypothetical protein
MFVRSANADERQDTAAVALRGRPRVARAIGQNPQLSPVVPAVRESNAPAAAQPPTRCEARMTTHRQRSAVFLSRPRN